MNSYLRSKLTETGKTLVRVGELAIIPSPYLTKQLRKETLKVTFYQSIVEPIRVKCFLKVWVLKEIPA